MKANKLSDVGMLILRVVLAAIILYYGSQKMLGTFGGAGISTTLAEFKKNNGFPEWLTMLAIISEFCGGLGVLLGLFTRIAAFGIACTMAVAAWSMYSSSHEYKTMHLPLALFGIAVGLIFLGSGAYSLDAALFKNRRNAQQGNFKK